MANEALCCWRSLGYYDRRNVPTMANQAEVGRMVSEYGLPWACRVVFRDVDLPSDTVLYNRTFDA